MKPVRLHNISETGAVYTKALIQTNNVFLSAYKSALKPYEDAIRQGNKLTNFETLQYAATQVYFPNRRAIALIEKRYLGQITKEESAELDGIEELKGVTVLAATNRRDIIDPALLRAGRFDIQIELPVPDEKGRQDILRIHTFGKPLANDVDLDRLASVTSGLVGSDIEGICRTASMLAIRDYVSDHTASSPSSDVVTFKVAARHFEQAIHEMSGKPR